jgi:hypothetical protein
MNGVSVRMVCLIRLPVQSFADPFAQDPSLFFLSTGVFGHMISLNTLVIFNHAISGCR